MTIKKNLSEKSNLLIKLTLRKKGIEIVAEGTLSSIYKELDALTDFARKVAEQVEAEEEFAVSSEEIAEVSRAEIEKVPTAEVPFIKASKSTGSNLEALFDTSWGRTPRSLAEIMKALEINAIPDRPESVQSYLIRLVQRGKLRRMKKEGKYTYFKLPE
jgi:hypothetical protein